MILVIGGHSAGKRKYALDNFGYYEMSNDIFDKNPVLYDLQNCEYEYSENLMNAIMLKKIVICNEIGCGIVPICEKERKQREKIGKITQEIAQKATSVIRVYCGIGQKLK